jgi:hypothetical protein
MAGRNHSCVSRTEGAGGFDRDLRVAGHLRFDGRQRTPLALPVARNVSPASANRLKRIPKSCDVARALRQRLLANVCGRLINWYSSKGQELRPPE